MAHQQTILDLAYKLWEARGCPIGSPEVDWRAAEREVNGGPLAIDDPDALDSTQSNSLVSPLVAGMHLRTSVDLGS